MKDNKYYSDMFEGKATKEGNFYQLKEDATPDLKTFIADVHLDNFGDILPNEWIYFQIVEAFVMWGEYEDKDAFVDEVFGVRNNYDLWEWSWEPFAHKILNETLESGGYTDFFRLIEDAQLKAIKIIKNAVKKFMEE